MLWIGAIASFLIYLCLFYYPFYLPKWYLQLAEYYFTTTYSAIIKGLKKQGNWMSKPDRFTKQIFFKRDTNLFATGNAARNYNKVSNKIGEGF
jgi:hypothetical protein